MKKMLPSLERARHAETGFFMPLLCIIGVLILLIAPPGCTQMSPLPDPLEAGWNNQSVCELLQDNDDMRVLKCTFPPGVGHEKHYHDAYFGYAVAGSKFRIRDTTGIREVDLPTGSNFYNEGVAWHEVLNIGDSTAVFLIIEAK